MFVYFSCGYPAVVKLDGAYLGRCDVAAKPVRIDSDQTFIEICPLNGEPSSGFMLDKKSLSSPPSFISVVDLKGGYMIRAAKPLKTSEFHILAQEKFSDAIITIFCENSLKISIETPNGFLGDEFPFCSNFANITRSANTAAVFFEDVNALYLYDLTVEPKKIGSVICSSFNMQNGIMTTLNKKDIAKHEIISYWKVDGGELIETERKVTASATFSRENLSEKLIPYAFAEEICAGGDFDFYLSDELAGKESAIKSYLGEFIAVMPPPPFRDYNEVGLVYKVNKNVYSVDYMTVDLKNGKIDNIKRSEI